MKAKLGCWLCALIGLSWCILTFAAEQPADGKAKPLVCDKDCECAKSVGTNTTASDPSGTHEQTGTIALTDGGTTQVNTFCLDPAGRLLVALGGTTRATSADGKAITTGNRIDVYSLDGQKTASWESPIVPQAINVAPDGSIFIAGAGEVAHLDNQGQFLKKAGSPVVVDIEQFKKELKDQGVRQQEERKQDMQDQVDRAEATIEKLKSKPVESMGALDKLRLKNAERLLTKLKAAGDQPAEQQVDLDYLISYKLRVPGLAITEKDLFVVFSASKGYGYEVWRMSHDLTQPEKVVSGLSGCCGQMDIQCCGEDLFVAENSRHRVGRYNRDGEQLAAFGKGDRTGKDGFEGCCNPMNLRFGPSGEVLTAESNGSIKKFTAAGQYLGLVGNAQLQGGCKHVAIAATPDASKVFMLDITNRRLCVLQPKPKQTAALKQAD